MTAGMCQCGHNRSFHRSEWNKFRGERDTSCRSTSLGFTGRDGCRCQKFDDWPIIQLPAGPTDAELEAERDAKHAAELKADDGCCLAPALTKTETFGVWPRCAEPKGHGGPHATTWGHTWKATS